MFGHTYIHKYVFHVLCIFILINWLQLNSIANNVFFFFVIIFIELVKITLQFFILQIFNRFPRLDVFRAAWKFVLQYLSPCTRVMHAFLFPTVWIFYCCFVLKVAFKLLICCNLKLLFVVSNWTCLWHLLFPLVAIASICLWLFIVYWLIVLHDFDSTYKLIHTYLHPWVCVYSV